MSVLCRRHHVHRLALFGSVLWDDFAPASDVRVLGEFEPWRFDHKCRTMPPGRTLRIEALASARIRWSADGCETSRDLATRDTGLGVHLADLPTEDLPAGRTVVFTFRWTAADRWEGTDFDVEVG